MKEIVETLKKRISENKNSMLVTVVAGRGSIPRKAGAYMVVGEDGMALQLDFALSCCKL